MKPKKPRRWWLVVANYTPAHYGMYNTEEAAREALLNMYHGSVGWSVVPVQEILPKRAKKRDR